MVLKEPACRSVLDLAQAMLELHKAVLECKQPLYEYICGMPLKRRINTLFLCVNKKRSQFL